MICEQDILNLYDAFNTRDIDAALSYLAPDVDWPNAMTQDRLNGHGAVRTYWASQWKVLDSTVRPLEIVRNGQEFEVTVHQVVKNGGRVIADDIVVHVFTTTAAADLVARMRVRAIKKRDA